ncbi:MMPL domain protein [Stackebrandtia nassauensis DSM 44728]|uniref:MMPL domain protein n=1 Tax=Stackebrandtia nassauensis (strain DSM 44728 / CIP 108903 / NRRL B-16338 / NBRC 102104 / LLR-40K-21) TaxID=446470 RepID=D3QAW7_STANL|nr:MMPL domain protein [Stackebrandtia nassauensis DSM 44728]
MFAGWGRAVVRLRWAILLLGAGVIALGATWGAGVFDSLSDGGFYNDKSPSAKAEDHIEDEFGRQDTDVVALYESKDDKVTDADFAESVTDVIADVEDRDEVEKVSSCYADKIVEGDPRTDPKVTCGEIDDDPNPFVSDDDHSTYVAITLNGEDDAARAEQFEDIRDDLKAEGLTTTLGGQAAIFDDVNTQTKADMVTAETYSMPILLGLMIIIFGSLVAATTPLLVGVLAIMGGFIITRLLTYVTDVSVFAINVITIIGLGLAIDYALFVVNRFREELDNGQTKKDAVSRTMATAGRTVMVSGLTIILSLAGLLLFPLPFLHGIAYGGMAAVAVAMLGSLTVLPALLAVLGHRVDAVRMPWRRKGKKVTKERGVWSKIGGSVMRRPALYIIGVLAILAVLASPFLNAAFGTVDEKVLPSGTESRTVTETMEKDFPNGKDGTLTIFVDGGGDVSLAQTIEDVEDLDLVEAVTPLESNLDSAVLQVRYDADAQSPEARDLADEILALEPPTQGTVEVTGMPAQLNDQFSDIGERLPWLGLYVAAVTLLLLFLAFGSILLPLKAILMNIVSIGASFGVIVWIFQEGHLSNLLGFTPSGYLEPSNLLLMVVLLFGLSTDYEVFLLSRVREEWDRTGDNTASVLTGLQRTGGIITSAALLLIVVVVSFAMGGIVFLKMIGIGMAVAIFVDATLVRMLLVPATMRILGRANWWAPRFLGIFYAKYGVKEGEDPEPAPERELVGAGK